MNYVQKAEKALMDAINYSQSSEKIQALALAVAALKMENQR